MKQAHRPPAVAGTFYPGQPAALQHMIEGLFPDREVERREALALVAPHAGYVYSGRVAAATIARTRPASIYVVVGPNHRGAGAPIAVDPSAAWDTPLGSVPVDRELAGALQRAAPFVAVDPRAHRWEHSLEVQVPLLQAHVGPRFRIVPVAIAYADFATCQALGEALARLVDLGGDVVLYASTDMSHYEPDDVTRRKDRLALRPLEKLDPAGLYTTVRNHRISMCGVLPTVAVLEACRRLGADRAELVDYATSGDVTGDLDRVVGYAGLVVPRP